MEKIKVDKETLENFRFCLDKWEQVGQGFSDWYLLINILEAKNILSKSGVNAQEIVEEVFSRVVLTDRPRLEVAAAQLKGSDALKDYFNLIPQGKFPGGVQFSTDELKEKVEEFWQKYLREQAVVAELTQLGLTPPLVEEFHELEKYLENHGALKCSNFTNSPAWYFMAEDNDLFYIDPLVPKLLIHLKFCLKCQVGIRKEGKSLI